MNVPKRLIIVESPAKAKTIESILHGEYEVISSSGHVRDLPSKRFGVDIDKNFQPEFKIIDGKEKIVKEISSKARGKEILLASDIDREGEAIAWHLAEILNIPKEEKNRIVFNEITPNAIKRAVQNPRTIDMNKVEAQLARRILDRIVGYRISPILWKMLRSGLSAGRVQSAALRIICDREVQRYKFKPKKFWRVQAEIDGLKANLARINGKKIKPDEITQDTAMKIKNAVKEVAVKEIKRREVRKKHPEPFITSTLQQEAANRFGFSVKRTMQIAQQLYEGVETPEGHMAFITYMRTDSTRISETAAKMAKNYIEKHFGKEYVSTSKRKTKNKKNIQDAHEAIRPTDVEITPEKAKKLLKKEYATLYELIWKRFMASQMSDARYEETTIIFESKEYEFETKIEIRTFDGFESILRESKPKSKVNIPTAKTLPVTSWNINEDETKPPPRYTEATMVKTLESNNIGRPSTYASVISTLIDRKYVIKRSRELLPTVLGSTVNYFLKERFPDIVNIEFTAHMEESLDEVENGKKHWSEVLKEFYEDFSKYLEKAESVWFSIDIETNVECSCGSSFNMKTGRYGLYLSCPSCGKTMSLAPQTPGIFLNGKMILEKQTHKEADNKCPSCGGTLEVLFGRYGEYLKCKNCGKTYQGFARGKCPKCSSPVERKRSKKGRLFFKCTNSSCDYMSWNEPSNQRCEVCGEPLVYLRRKGKEVLYCPKCKKVAK